MKKEQAQYEKVISTLRRSKPRLENKTQLNSQILARIREPARENHLIGQVASTLFGWMDVMWMRWSVSTLALTITGIFFLQQYQLNRKIASLEDQLVRMEEQVASQHSSMNRGQMFLMKMYANPQGDSIKVSREDLDKLLEEYKTLKESGEKRAEDKSNHLNL